MDGYGAAPDAQMMGPWATLTPQQQQFYMQQMRMQMATENMLYGMPGPQNMGAGYAAMPSMYATSRATPPPAPAAPTAPAAPPKREKLRVKLRPEERGKYSSLFDLCSKGNPKIEAKDCLVFLRRSGLDTDTLQSIWKIAAQTAPSTLNRDEFYVALRLVALAQAGKEVSANAIIIDIDAPIPKFEAHVDGGPDDMQPADGRAPGWGNRDSTNPSGGSWGSDRYAMSESDIQKCLQIYDMFDPDNRGYLQPPQITELLKKTQLPGNTANLLRTICDETGTGTFTKVNAVVLLCLAMLATKKVPPPREVPEDLKRKVTALVGTSPPPPPRNGAAGGGTAMAYPGSRTYSGSPSYDTGPRTDISADDGDALAVIKKEVELAKADLAELREEEGELREKTATQKEQNKLLGEQLQKLKDALTQLKASVHQQKTQPPRAPPSPAYMPPPTSASPSAPAPAPQRNPPYGQPMAGGQEGQFQNQTVNAGARGGLMPTQPTHIPSAPTTTPISTNVPQTYPNPMPYGAHLQASPKPSLPQRPTERPAPRPQASPPQPNFGKDADNFDFGPNTAPTVPQTNLAAYSAAPSQKPKEIKRSNWVSFDS